MGQGTFFLPHPTPLPLAFYFFPFPLSHIKLHTLWGKVPFPFLPPSFFAGQSPPLYCILLGARVSAARSSGQDPSFLSGTAHTSDCTLLGAKSSFCFRLAPRGSISSVVPLTGRSSGPSLPYFSPLRVSRARFLLAPPSQDDGYGGPPLDAAPPSGRRSHAGAAGGGAARPRSPAGGGPRPRPPATPRLATPRGRAGAAAGHGGGHPADPALHRVPLGAPRRGQRLGGGRRPPRQRRLQERDQSRAEGAGDLGGPLEPVHPPGGLLRRPLLRDSLWALERQRGPPADPGPARPGPGPASRRLPGGHVPEAPRGVPLAGLHPEGPDGGLQPDPGGLLRLRGGRQRPAWAHLPGCHFGGLHRPGRNGVQYRRRAVAQSPGLRGAVLARVGCGSGCCLLRRLLPPGIGRAEAARETLHPPPLRGHLPSLWRSQPGRRREEAGPLLAGVLPCDHGAFGDAGPLRPVRAQLPALLGLGADRLWLGGRLPGLPHQPGGAAAASAVPGGQLGGRAGTPLQRCGAGGDFAGGGDTPDVHRLWTSFPFNGCYSRDPLQAVQISGCNQTGCSLCCRGLCRRAVLPSGHGGLQLPLPGVFVLHEGLPVPLRSSHPPGSSCHCWVDRNQGHEARLQPLFRLVARILAVIG